jgi:hypothetical protein
MDFVGGALPNVMFIAGLIAIGIGLGIEFKIVEVKGQLSKQSRIGAIVTGALLILMSVFLYTRPAQAPALTTMPAQANAGLLPPQASTAAQPPTAAPTATPLPTAAPAATPLPAAAPTATPLPTAAPTSVPGVTVPDIRGKNTKDAQKILNELGLQLGDRHDRCEDIGASDDGARRLKKDQIRCQSPAPGSIVAPNEHIAYVLGDSREDD